MTWPAFLGLEDIGWEWIATDRQSRTEVLPKLVSIHGHQPSRATVVESGMARKGIQKYGRSVTMGAWPSGVRHPRRDTTARRSASRAAVSASWTVSPTAWTSTEGKR
jgi:hypothetical protein